MNMKKEIVRNILLQNIDNLQSETKPKLFFVDKKNGQQLGFDFRMVGSYPYAIIDTQILNLFKAFDKDKIEKKIPPRYRDSFINSYERIAIAIMQNQSIKLNALLAGLLGPYFYPDRGAHHYNVYDHLFFKLEDIKNNNLKIDSNRLKNAEKIIIWPQEFISINELSDCFIVERVESDFYEKESEKYNFETILEKAKNKEDNVNTQNNDFSEINNKSKKNNYKSSTSQKIFIKNIEISNFIHYEKITTDLSPSINLIVGENDTGKTSLMKLLYATTKAWERSSLDSRKTFKQFLSEKIFNVYNLTRKGIGAIVRLNSNQDLSVKISYETNDTEIFETIEYQFGNSTVNSIRPEKIKDIKPVANQFNTIFLPAKELLSMWDIIKFSDDKFPTGFDDTVYDLFKKLNLPQQIGNLPFELISANKKLEQLLNGKIILLNEGGKTRFVFEKQSGGVFDMDMTAEGIKQLGILTTLIQNWEINQNTVLFLDEPDTNLNPKATRELANVLVDISKAGAQIFITSHNYFLVKQLAIAAKKNSSILINCYNITKNKKTNNMELVKYNLEQGIPTISIVEEALKMYDEEVALDFL